MYEATFIYQASICHIQCAHLVLQKLLFFIEVSSEYCLIRSYTFGTTPGNRGTKIQLIIWPTPIIAVWIGFYGT